MFNENLKTLRMKKGYTQETLAIKVHVVRQTVSKWEKGLSVPDAVTLQKIAEVLEVSVNELLGAKVMQQDDVNEVAEQLARINEQLAIRNRRWRRFWKAVGIILAIILLINILGIALYSFSEESYTEQIEAEKYIED